MMQMRVAAASATAILVVLACLELSFAAASEKESRSSSTERAVTKSTPESYASTTLPSKARLSKAGRKPARSPAGEISPAAATPTKSTVEVPAAAAAAPAPTVAAINQDSPYSHLFHPSAIDLSGFFGNQFGLPGKQEQIDLASFYNQIGQPVPLPQQPPPVYTQTFGTTIYNGVGPRKPQQQQAVYYQQPGAHAAYIIPQPVPSRKPIELVPDYPPKSANPIVFPSQKPQTFANLKQPLPTVSNDYSTVFQAQRPTSATLAKNKRPTPTKSFQSSKPPTAEDYASVYQKSPSSSALSSPGASRQPSPSSSPQFTYANLYQNTAPTGPQGQRPPQVQYQFVPQNTAVLAAQAGANAGAQAGQQVVQVTGGSAPGQQGQPPVKVDINQLINSQVIPQIQQGGQGGIQLLDLSEFYPQGGAPGAGAKPGQVPQFAAPTAGAAAQFAGQRPTFYQVGGGKMPGLTPLQLSPHILQSLQQAVHHAAASSPKHPSIPAASPTVAVPSASAPALPTFSPEQLAAFYRSVQQQTQQQSIAAVPSGPQGHHSQGHHPQVSYQPQQVYHSPPQAAYPQHPTYQQIVQQTAQPQHHHTPPTRIQASSGPAYPTGYAVAAPPQGVPQGVPQGIPQSVSQVAHTQPGPQVQQAVLSQADLSSYYSALSAAQAQAQAHAQAAAQGQPQGIDLAAFYKQHQLRGGITVSAPTATGGSGGASSSGLGPRAPQGHPGVIQYAHPQHTAPAAAATGPHSNPRETYPGYNNLISQASPAAYYPQQQQGAARPGTAAYAHNSASIASLITQLTGSSLSPSSPTLSPSYYATTAAAAPQAAPKPKRPRPNYAQHFAQLTASAVTPTPNPTQPAMPAKQKQLVKKPHNFGDGYSFEITGRR